MIEFFGSEHESPSKILELEEVPDLECEDFEISVAYNRSKCKRESDLVEVVTVNTFKRSNCKREH